MLQSTVSFPEALETWFSLQLRVLRKLWANAGYARERGSCHRCGLRALNGAPWSGRGADKELSAALPGVSAQGALPPPPAPGLEHGQALLVPLSPDAVKN